MIKGSGPDERSRTMTSLTPTYPMRMSCLVLYMQLGIFRHGDSALQKTAATALLHC